MKYGWHTTRDSGAALLSALLILAFVSLLATAVVLQERSVLRSVQKIFQSDQARLLLDGLDFWAIASIQKHFKIDPKTQEIVSLLTVQHLAPQQIAGYSVEAHLRSASAFFNLNALMRNPDTWSRFENVLRVLQLSSTEKISVQLTHAIAMWLLGIEKEDYYLQRHPPYRSGRRLFAHLSELRAVQGFNASLVLSLSPYVLALPSTELLLNPRAMLPQQAQILSAVLEVEQEKANTLIACAQSIPEEEYTLQNFKLRCSQVLHLDPLASALFSVDNRFYLLSAEARKASHRYVFNSLLEVQHSFENRKPNVKVVVLWRHFEP